LRIDERGIPAVEPDPRLQREWAEIERRAEDRCVSPIKELQLMPKEQVRLANYGLQQMERRLLLMQRARDAVRARLIGLAILDVEMKLVASSVRALEIAVARKTEPLVREKVQDVAKELEVSIRRTWQGTAVQTVIGLATGFVEKERASFEKRLRGRIEKEVLSDAQRIARAATEILRDGSTQDKQEIPARPLAEALASFEGLARGFWVQRLDLQPQLMVQTTLVFVEPQKPDSWDVNLSVWRNNRGPELDLLKKYRRSVVELAGRKRFGTAALLLVPIHEILEELGTLVPITNLSMLKARLLWHEMDAKVKEFPDIIGRFAGVADAGKVQFYEDVELAIRAIFRLVRPPEKANE
jgi:hypothetical protein